MFDTVAYAQTDLPGGSTGPGAESDVYDCCDDADEKIQCATGRRLVGDVHVGRSEKVLQRHEETRLQATSETDTETAGSLRLDNAFQLQTSLTLTDPTENTNDHHRFAAIMQANLR